MPYRIYQVTEPLVLRNPQSFFVDPNDIVGRPAWCVPPPPTIYGYVKVNAASYPTWRGGRVTRDQAGAYTTDLVGCSAIAIGQLHGGANEPPFSRFYFQHCTSSIDHYGNDIRSSIQQPQNSWMVIGSDSPSIKEIARRIQLLWPPRATIPDNQILIYLTENHQNVVNFAANFADGTFGQY